MSVRTRFWLLAAIRWSSTGLIVPVAALLPLDRGLSVAEYGSVAAVQGIVVLALELPTGGFADAVGRRPVFVASAAVALCSYVVYAMAQTPAAFALATALAGAYRALDSGPLNAWFVDAVHDEVPEQERPAVVAKGLAGYASVVGLGIAGGAILSAGLVAWAPFGRSEALALPYWIAAGLSVVQMVAALLLMGGERVVAGRSLLSSVRATPRTILDGARLLLRSRVLSALVAVELFWGFGMISFETLMPVRLAELVGDRDEAASLMGPVTAAAWGVSALGAAMVPLLLRRWSMVGVSVALRIVQGGTVVAMGLAAGPIGLVAGLFATYAVHSMAGAIHETLLHQQVDREHRATVLSLGSMVMHPGGSLGLVVLGALATSVSTGFAMVVGGVVLALAAPLFLVRAPAPAGTPQAPMLDDDGVRRGRR
ncbi:MFS transporter [Aeromicrobium chenweiae]|uniref:MFS transporter n=1 Tax=Aeromicrobium chenweiae TaxID=2079793 RepID=A0A2S0WNJ9_9ACTN|nr:MFS transporter [Aeromicrobium chenweiae]AWB92923.1 MFS transporter [Aeromicrobium chenweiae]TGN33918.1 MFS transporter [Aeromicrobium chenweiae]